MLAVHVPSPLLSQEGHTSVYVALNDTSEGVYVWCACLWIVLLPAGTYNDAYQAQSVVCLAAAAMLTGLQLMGQLAARMAGLAA